MLIEEGSSIDRLDEDDKDIVTKLPVIDKKLSSHRGRQQTQQNINSFRGNNGAVRNQAYLLKQGSGQVSSEDVKKDSAGETSK